MATDGINRRPIAPALTGHFTDHGLALGGHSIGDFFAQIKITPDTFVVWAAEGKDGLGVCEIYRVFDLAAAVNAFRIKELQIHS